MNATLLTRTRLSLKSVSTAPTLVYGVELPLTSLPLTSEFHLSPNLPIELRIQIWITILYTSRTIKVSHNPSLPGYICASGPPALFSTNRESRLNALALQKQGAIQYLFASGRTRLFFNPEHDTLYFGKHVHVSPYFFLGDCQRQDWLKIRRLALQDTKLAEIRFDSELWRRMFMALVGLEELIIVFDGDVEGAFHCEMCKNKRRLIEDKCGWSVPTRGPWAAFDRFDGVGRVHDAIQRGFRRGDGLWDWVWQAMHEGGGGG
jgi:hypothetical protein